MPPEIAIPRAPTNNRPLATTARMRAPLPSVHHAVAAANEQEGQHGRPQENDVKHQRRSGILLGSAQAFRNRDRRFADEVAAQRIGLEKQRTQEGRGPGKQEAEAAEHDDEQAEDGDAGVRRFRPL